MKCYKGFDKNLKCRGFQYEVGKEYKEASAELCKKGFHACEYPLNVFNYYPPADSRFCEVELDGVTNEKDSDSKRCGTKIVVKAEIGMTGIVKAAVDFIMDKTADSKPVINTGDQSAATNTGYRSAATVVGKESVAVCTGYKGKVQGSLGCWIALAEWDEGGNHIVDFKSARVDGKNIKADVFYTLKNGRFEELNY